MSPEDGANLPIPHRERNSGGDLQVSHYHHHGPNGMEPWPKVAASHNTENPSSSGWHHEAPPSGWQQTPSPERKIFGLTLPVFTLSFILFLVTAALVTVGTVLGTKIANLEDTVHPLTLDTSSGSSSGSGSGSNIDHSGSGSSNDSSIDHSDGGSGSTSLAPGVQPPQTVVVPGWRYVGCFYDSEIRMLAGPRISANNMTNRVCASFCEGAGRGAPLRHFGTQSTRQCFCGAATDHALQTQRAPDWQCSRQCSGASGRVENCGGIWSSSLWERDGEEEEED